MSTHPSDVWLDKARIEIYEEIKDMTVEEEVAYLRAMAAPVLKKYNLKTVSLPIVRIEPVRERKAVSE
jgi:hypothetical protein